MNAIALAIIALGFTQTSLALKIKKDQEKIDFHPSIVESQVTAKEYSKEVKKSLSLTQDQSRKAVVFTQPKEEVEVIVAPATEFKKPSARPAYKASKKLEKKQFERLAEEFNSSRD